jgi:hypothetical protein
MFVAKRLVRAVVDLALTIGGGIAAAWLGLQLLGST